MFVNKTVVVTAFAVFATMMVPVSSVAAVPGGLLDEEEVSVVTETGTGSSVIGELPTDEGVFVATEYQGNRIAVSVEQQSDFSWTDLQNDELSATRLLIGDDSAYGRSAASSEKGANYTALVNSDGFSVLIEIISADSDNEYDFDIDLPDATTLILTDEGSVDCLVMIDIRSANSRLRGRWTQTATIYPPISRLTAIPSRRLLKRTRPRPIQLWLILTSHGVG